jgi:hypothetical protein
MKLQIDTVPGSKKAKGNDDFRELLLNGPVMSPKQYKEFKTIRNRINKWRVK